MIHKYKEDEGREARGELEMKDLSNSRVSLHKVSQKYYTIVNCETFQTKKNRKPPN